VAIRPLTCAYLVAGQDLNLRPLGYETYDNHLRRLTPSPAAVPASINAPTEVSPSPPGLPHVTLSRLVRFTNPFTSPLADLGSSPSAASHAPGRLSRAARRGRSPRTAAVDTFTAALPRPRCRSTQRSHSPSYTASGGLPPLVTESNHCWFVLTVLLEQIADSV